MITTKKKNYDEEDDDDNGDDDDETAIHFSGYAIRQLLVTATKQR